MKKLFLGALLSGLLGFFLAGKTFAQQPGILNQPAPPLQITEWRNLPEGQTTLDIKDLKGKVVYLFGFQNW